MRQDYKRRGVNDCKGVIRSRPSSWGARQPGGTPPVNHNLCKVGVLRGVTSASPAY